MPPATPILPVDLTLPQGTSRTVHTLLSAAVTAAMSTAVALGSQPTRPGALDPLSVYRQRALAALRAERGLLASSLLQPSRLVLARLLGLGLGTAAERRTWAQELALLLTLDAAECGALSAPIRLQLTGDQRMVSERSRTLFELTAGSTLTLSSSGLTLGEVSASWGEPLEVLQQRFAPVGVTVRQASVPLYGQASLVLSDTNPLAGVELHPDKSGSYVDLGERAPEVWVDALQKAFAIIEEHLPEIAAEMRLLLRHVVPVGYFDEKHLSASYLEAIGVVYVSLHPHTMTLVEALVHEFQHNKLNLLLGMDRVLENADAPLFSSPVRPDPRPLRGVLLAVHAFHPIVRLYERLVAIPERPDNAWLSKRLGEVARLCHEGCEVLLPNGEPTEVGAPLLREITSLDALFNEHLTR